MDSSFGVSSVWLRVITFVFLFLLLSVFADNSSVLRSPDMCFGESYHCSLSVKYPLENAYQLSYDRCGYPGFEVYCNDYLFDERLLINISNHIYHVLDIYYQSNALILVDIDVEGSGCPEPKRNISFPSSPSWVNYDISSYNYNIIVFYNCSSVPVDAEKHILCSKDDTSTPPSYALYNNETEGFDWYGNCTQNVVVPVMSTSRDISLYTVDAIKLGFYMSWHAFDWCGDCEFSGGHCWSNSTAATGCACKNGKSYKETCPPDWCQDCERSGGQCGSIHNSTATSCTCKNNKSFNGTCLPQTPLLHRG